MADPRRTADACARYGPLQEAFEGAGGYAYRARIQQVLRGLGFAEADFSWLLGQLSGNERTRAVLARLPLEDPAPLLLDEPTDQLDVEAMEWLEGWLKEWPGALVVVSHDRYFLDEVVDTVWELGSRGVHICGGATRPMPGGAPIATSIDSVPMRRSSARSSVRRSTFAATLRAGMPARRKDGATGWSACCASSPSNALRRNGICTWSSGASNDREIGCWSRVIRALVPGPRGAAIPGAGLRPAARWMRGRARPQRRWKDDLAQDAPGRNPAVVWPGSVGGWFEGGVVLPGRGAGYSGLDDLGEERAMAVHRGGYRACREAQQRAAEAEQAGRGQARRPRPTRARPAKPEPAMDTIEGRIDELERELASLAGQLEMAGSDVARVRRLGTEYAAIERELERWLEEWKRLLRGGAEVA